VSLRVGIVGCGRMGAKRAAALDGDLVVGCVDRDASLAAALGPVCNDLDALLELRPDAVIVSTTPDALADVACRALEAGTHVLVEKPAGVRLADVEAIDRAAHAAGRVAWVGFNHRYHPAIARAIAEARSGEHGPVLFVRGRYGHGGRLGYGEEWRFDRAVSGGGELVDQGMHLLDLCHAIAGPLDLHAALLRSSYWGDAVEDNAAILLESPGDAGGTWATLHAGWTEWKNIFSLEVSCRTAKLQVDGLAGSYGAPRLTIYRMRPELGPPDVEEIAYPPEDVSWSEEWRAFRARAVAGEGKGTLDAALWAWGIVEDAYARAGVA
jgi:predicted dehydrogenase